MRRRWMVIGLILLAGFQAAGAQFIASKGVRAGVALSNQSYQITSINYMIETDPILSPSLVLFAEAFKGDHFSLRTDLAFACRGSSTTTQSVSVNHLEGDRVIVNEGEKATSRHRYLSLAPMLRARTGNGGIEPYALIGPRLDMFLYYSSQSEFPLEEQNRFILGISMGVGAEFKLSQRELFAEILYQPDLSPVVNTEPLMVNNNSLVLTLGISF
ncbi:MAG: PorT family protein [Bacteroidetes bacterium]|nr:PorT family protein [Bacteroidota bacterium]